MHDDDFMPTDDETPLGVLPWSIESECSVLGGLLLSNDAWDRVGDALLAEDFYRNEHRVIFDGIARLVMAGKIADVVTVFEHLNESGKADEAGGLEYLNQLAQYVPSASNIRRYAEIVAERALMRKLLAAADHAREIAVMTGLNVSQRLDQCTEAFQSLTIRRSASAAQPLGELLTAALNHISDMHSGNALPGIPTKLPTWDKLTAGGHQSGKQVVIAARPSVGKTALALTLAKNAAMAGHPAAVLSMEMEKQELVQRYLADVGEIDLSRLKTGRLNNDEWPALTEAVDKLTAMPIYIDDQASMSLADVQIKARKLKREHGIKLLVIDYLQLMAPANPKDNRHHQIEAISRGLKVLAKQLDLTTIVLSQLGRDVEKRTDKRPTLADLKESGAIEEDADVVVLLHNESAREDGTQVIHAEIAKNRGGAKGGFKLAFTGRHQRVVETIATPAETRFCGSQARPVYTEEC